MPAPLTWDSLPSVLVAQSSGSSFVHQLSRPACLMATWSADLNAEVPSPYAQPSSILGFLTQETFLGPHIYYTYSETFQAELEGRKIFCTHRMNNNHLTVSQGVFLVPFCFVWVLQRGHHTEPSAYWASALSLSCTHPPPALKSFVCFCFFFLLLNTI